MVFCGIPVLFDEIEFAMILGVEVTDVTMGLNEFFQTRFLCNEIRLHEE